MLKLLAVTLIGLFIVLKIYGEGDAVSRAQQQAEPATAPVAQDDAASNAAIVQVAQQTPEQVPEFPGPELRPSPEYAGQVETTLPEGAPRLYVTGNRVNFRAGPSTADRVMGALERGAEVAAIGPTNAGWIEIRDTTGRTGFMSASFLSPNAP